MGEYELLARIGEGGMGVVHLARKPGGERVAVKMLRPHVVGDEEARARLAREVSSLSRIRNRWVAEIIDADPWAEVPFVATRYVPGLSLHDHVPQEGPIRGPDLLWFAGCLAEGLAGVHEVGVLHRDIKPSNVLMEGRTPILIDFGLARVAEDPKLTHTGWLLGTPGYLAPEILYGDEATAASDVHSWGATVAYAATGEPPFGRGPSMAIMDRVRRGEHRLDGLEGPLREVVQGALRPDPAHRPSLEAILEWLRPQTTRPSPVLAPLPGGCVRGRPAAVEDPYTQPLALATPALGGEEETLVDDSPPVTRRLPGAPTARPAPYPVGGGAPPPVVWDPRSELAQGWDPYSELAPPPAPVGPMERLRRGLLLVLGAGLLGVCFAVAPWLATLGAVVGVWLLRSGSSAASSVAYRRRLRGARWHDGPRVLLGAPWHLIRSIPGSSMLLLWSGGLALAAALGCYALAAGVPLTLAVSGVTLAVSLWWGPGGTRVRSPLSRVVRPLSRSGGPWLLAVGVLLVLGLLGGLRLQDQGVSWAPGDGPPLSNAR